MKIILQFHTSVAWLALAVYNRVSVMREKIGFPYVVLFSYKSINVDLQSKGDHTCIRVRQWNPFMSTFRIWLNWGISFCTVMCLNQMELEFHFQQVWAWFDILSCEFFYLMELNDNIAQVNVYSSYIIDDRDEVFKFRIFGNYRGS